MVNTFGVSQLKGFANNWAIQLGNFIATLLNYLLLIAKIYLWDCRRTQILPNTTSFKLKVNNKFETEKYVCVKKYNTLDKFNKKWLINK